MSSELGNVRSQPIVIQGTNELAILLETLTGAGYPRTPGWEEQVVADSPILGSYIVKGFRAKLATYPSPIRLNIPGPWLEPVPGPKTIRTLPSFPTPWDVVVESIAIPLSVACAAGGFKALIELLKLWVEERKGRRIVIRADDLQIELEGVVSHTQVRQLIDMFESRFLEPDPDQALGESHPHPTAQPQAADAPSIHDK